MLSLAIGDRGRGRVMCLERRIRTPDATSTASPGVSDRGKNQKRVYIRRVATFPQVLCSSTRPLIIERYTMPPPRCGRAVLGYVCQGRVCVLFNCSTTQQWLNGALFKRVLLGASQDTIRIEHTRQYGIVHESTGQGMEAGTWDARPL